LRLGTCSHPSGRSGGVANEAIPSRSAPGFCLAPEAIAGLDWPELLLFAHWGSRVVNGRKPSASIKRGRPDHRSLFP